MSKLTIHVREFHSVKRNTLIGFATIWIAEMKLTIKEVAIHAHTNGSRWAQLPSRPMVKDGTVLKQSDGKVAYATLMDFDNRTVRDAFSAAVVKALLEKYPQVFDAHQQQGAA